MGTLVSAGWVSAGAAGAGTAVACQSEGESGNGSAAMAILRGRSDRMQDAVQEILRARVARVGKNCTRGALFDDDAMIKEQHPVGDLPGKAHLVGHHHH